MAQLVVDRLEPVDVEQDDRQRPLVPGRAGQFAVQEFDQVALVVDLREAVDDRQAVDFFVVLGLDVAAGEEAEDAVADTAGNRRRASSASVTGRSLTNVPLVLCRSWT